jgi:hypothetical protein
MRPVRIISREGKAVLVQWLDDDGCYRRGALPPKSVKNGRCSDEELDRSITYGESWAEWIEWPTVEEIEQELYRHNLWGFEDIENNAEVIRGIIMKPFEDVDG